MGALLALVLLVGYMVVGLLARGWVVYCLWGWFAVPLGVPPISVAWAIGLTSLVVCMVPTPQPDENRDKVNAMLLPFVNWGLCLLVGWVVHLYMT